MSPVQDPSENSPVEDQIYDLLKEKNLRTMYRNCLNACREFHHFDAKAWFIQKLMDNNIIPSFYKIKNSSIDPKASETASLTSMGRDLEIAKAQAMVHGDTMTSHYNSLVVLTPAHLREPLLTKIKNRGLGFQSKFKSEKLKRYEHLSGPPKPPKASLSKDSGKKRKWVKKSAYQRNARKIKKTKISVIYNYSSVTLTPGMESLLNKGLNFAPTPGKVDLTQLEVDMRYFERNLMWTDVFDGEKDENFKPSIFRERKANFPTKYNPPEALRTFISSFKTDLHDPESRNKKIRSNLSQSEKAALSELKTLQKNRVITELCECLS